MNEAPLALRFNAPAAYGTNDELNAIVERMSALMPNAVLADWQLGGKYREDAERNLSNAFLKVAQLAVFYRLIPGVDLHIIPRKNQFIVDIGLESWRKAADRYCAMQGISYHIHTEQLSVDEVKERRGKDWMPDDVGAVAFLYRSDKEMAYKFFGKDGLSKAYGVWAAKATWNESRKEWTPDTIPNQRTKQDVAERRAIRAVLKKEFSLDSLLAATPAEVRESARNLESNIRYEEMRQAVPASRRVELDDDGFIIVEQPSRSAVINDVQFVVAEENDMQEGPDVDDLLDAAQEGTEQPQADDSDTVDYLALAKRLTGTAASFVQWTRKIHSGAGGPASLDQYRYLVGVLNKTVDNEQAHRLLLGVMIGRHVDSASTPNFHVCSKLLEWLVEFRKDEVTGQEVKNPAFRQDYADTVKAMWQTITEAA